MKLFLLTLLFPIITFAQVAPSDIIDQTNAYRASHGLNILMENASLDAAAQAKLNDEQTQHYFSHTNPQGKNSWYWFNLVGYKFTAAGENLAADFIDATSTMTAWEHSPEHNANLLGNYQEIGVASGWGFCDWQWGWFVVQLFGTR